MKPILFNTDMVKAILDGRKTVTRRLIKPIPKGEGDPYPLQTRPGYWNTWGDDFVYRQPYQPGDILYVRETWAEGFDLFGEFPQAWYRANFTDEELKKDDISEEIFTDFPQCIRWKPSIHMPRKYARIFLMVTSVRAERLQDVDGPGAYDEGAIAPMPGGCRWPKKPDRYDSWSEEKKNEWVSSIARAIYISRLEFSERLINAFHTIWDSTIKPADLPTCGWTANPWVWVIEFERCEKPEEE